MNNSTFRSGDRVSIPGSYQYDALTEGNAVQRFWHFNKQLVIEQYLPPQASDRIIDVGCGSGVVSEFLAKSGAEVLGIDGNADAISFASEKFQRQNLSFRKGLVDSQFEAEEPFDKIYCLEVLEHIYYDQGRQMLANFHRALRPEGAVFLTTPNYRSFWPLIEWLLDRSRLVPHLAQDQHVEYYHRRKLCELAKAAGFTVDRVFTTCFVAPWVAPLSRKLALKLQRMETGSSLPGSILVAVLRKPAPQST